MTIEQLRHFSEIARCGSFNKAAETLYMTQPNLSLSIKKLENELKEPVFNRSSTGVTLTAFGKNLLPHARSVLGLVEQIPDKTFDDDSKHIPKLSVAAIGTKMASEIIAQIYNAHMDEGIQIDYHDVTRDECVSMVSAGTVDIAFCAVLDFRKNYHTRIFKSKNVEFVPLVNEPIAVSVGRNNPLFAREEDWVTTDMIKDFPSIDHFSEHPTSLKNQLGLIKRKCIINCNTRASRGELLFLTNCLAIGVAPFYSYRKMPTYDDIRIFRLADTEHYWEIGYLKRKNMPLTPLAEEFVFHMKKLFDVE